MGVFFIPEKGGADLNGFLDWFTGSIRGFHMWEIQRATATIDDMKLWMALFNIILIAFIITILILARKSMPIAITVILSMFFATITTVALIR